jgi:UDP-N-acetylmuramoylalanine--D-glutamate ligase
MDRGSACPAAEDVGLIPGDLPSWLLDQVELVVAQSGRADQQHSASLCGTAGASYRRNRTPASRYLKGRIVAITGSNGKTTTTALVGQLLKDANLPVQVGGNIGNALISLVETSTDDGWTVVEVSSFQLETIREFHPAVAVVLNVTPNHMDRYENITGYAAAKHRIFMNQLHGDLTILNEDDEIVSSWASGLRAHVALFSVKRELAEGLFLRDQREIISRAGGAERTIMRRDEMRLRGLHNVENVLAALAAGLACGVAPESMRETVKRFEPVEHRLEFVGEIASVAFYNDSKATSVDATLKALEAFRRDPGKIVLLLGGRGKKATVRAAGSSGPGKG